MLVLASLTLSAEVNVYNGPYKGWSKAATLNADAFNYIVRPQKQACEPLWKKDKNTIYQTIFITLDDTTMLDVLSRQLPDSGKGLRVINKTLLQEYAPDATWQDYKKFTIFYLFDAEEECMGALGLIKKEAVQIRKNAKEIMEKMSEKSDRILKEHKKTRERDDDSMPSK